MNGIYRGVLTMYIIKLMLIIDLKAWFNERPN